MNCACAVVTNNSILRAGARRERERERERVGDATLFPRSPNWRTSSSREASWRRSDGSPIPPTPLALPSIRPSNGGRSVDQLAERPSGFQNAWTTSNRVTALRPLNSSCHPLAYIDVPLRNHHAGPPPPYQTFALRRKRASS